MYTTVAVQWNIYMYCGRHVCSVYVYVRNEYSACCMADSSDCICDTYICIHVPPMRYWLPGIYAEFGGHICF